MTFEDRLAYESVVTFGIVLALIGFAFLGFVSIEWHRTHPAIDLPLPSKASDMHPPPDLYPVQHHDVKG